MLHNKALWFVGVVVAAVGTGMGADIYQSIKGLDWANLYSAMKSDSSLQSVTLGALLPFVLVYLYWRKWRLNMEDPTLFFILMFGGYIVGYFIPFVFAILNGNTQSLFDDIRDHPYNKAWIFFVVVCWIGQIIVRTIITGHSPSNTKYPPVARGR